MSKISYFIVILSVLFFGCPKDEPCTTCPPPDNTPPGKREYVWSIDSVDYSNLPSTIQLKSIWGSSSTNVWGAGFTPDVRDCLWHYDSVKWTRATEGTPITVFGNGSKIVGRVWGTSADDVWAIGGRTFSNAQQDQPFVMHYDGTIWSEVTGDINNMPTGCTAIYGVRKNEFYVAQLNYIFHYNNGIWKKYKVGDNMLSWGLTGYKGIVYAVAYDISSGGNRAIIVRIQNDQLYIDDETTLTSNTGSYNGKFEPSKPWISNGKLYTAWHRIRETKILSDGSVDSSSWQSILSLPSGQYFVNTYFHTAKNVFVSGYPNLLYHYNGSDWNNINISVDSNPTPEGEYSAIWTDGKEIFICDEQNGIIYHGR